MPSMIARYCCFSSAFEPSSSARDRALENVVVGRYFNEAAFAAGLGGAGRPSRVCVSEEVSGSAVPFFRALALARIRFQRRSFMILPSDALVGLFQFPPMLSFHCALPETLSNKKNPI